MAVGWKKFREHTFLCQAPNSPFLLFHSCSSSPQLLSFPAANSQAVSFPSLLIRSPCYFLITCFLFSPVSAFFSASALFLLSHRGNLENFISSFLSVRLETTSIFLSRRPGLWLTQAHSRTYIYSDSHALCTLHPSFLSCTQHILFPSCSFARVYSPPSGFDMWIGFALKWSDEKTRLFSFWDAAYSLV